MAWDDDDDLDESFWDDDDDDDDLWDNPDEDEDGELDEEEDSDEPPDFVGRDSELLDLWQSGDYDWLSDAEGFEEYELAADHESS
jgi:hypothetical protein